MIAVAYTYMLMYMHEEGIKNFETEHFRAKYGVLIIT